MGYFILATHKKTGKQYNVGSFGSIGALNKKFSSKKVQNEYIPKSGMTDFIIINAPKKRRR